MLHDQASCSLRVPLKSAGAPRRLLVAGLLALATITTTTTTTVVSPTQAFHLSFGDRLTKSFTNPLLNPASNLIRPIECRNANNHSEVGICMFSIDCMQNKGVPLSVCKHNYFVGTCCKLPDYNNFVGILYDLRETEYSQLLEARRIMGDTAAANKSSTTSGPSTGPAFSTGASVAPLASEPVLANGSRQPAANQAADIGTLAPAEKFGERYVIGSSSLFPGPSPSSPAPSPAPPSSTLSSPSMEGSRPEVASESARSNPDSVPSPVLVLSAAPAQPQRILVPLAEAFQMQTSPGGGGSSQPALEMSTPGAALRPSSPESYELLPGAHITSLAPEIASASASSEDSLEVLSTLSSAHSALNTQQSSAFPASSSNQPPRLTTPSLAVSFSPDSSQSSGSSTAGSPSSATSSPPSSPAEPAPSVPASQATSTPDELRQQAQHNILMANNHQPSPSTGFQSLAVTASMASSMASSTMTSGAATPSLPPPSIPTTATLAETTSIRQSSSSPVGTEYPSSSAAPSSMSPASVSAAASASVSASSASSDQDFVVASNSSGAPESSSTRLSSASDLVSSPVPSTTPFTTSLSTAQLPNVTSHAYSPTPSPSATTDQMLVVSSGAASLQPLASGRPRPATNEPPGLASSLQAQFYSAQTSSLGPEPAGSSEAGSSTSTSSRSPATPSLYQLPQSPPHQLLGRPVHLGHLGQPMLQAATKIVTGASSANNLIPGLSGLQSAILSHIPFKLASGLSSGLSGYLQAIKPTGTRPLMSSNTAPALNLLKLNRTTQRPLLFPSSPPSYPSAALQALESSSASSSAQSSSPRDVVKQAEAVCGRPQAFTSSPSSSSPSSGASPSEGKRRVARIVGGNQSSFGQWPWMVSLRQWRKGAFLHKCGAALLNENWAITAAHCVENATARDLLLRLGEFDVSNQDEPFPYIERRVKTVVSHPSFNPKTFEYDLALMRFAGPVKFERNIIPVCVPSGNDSYVDRMATVIGWGRLYEDGPLPDVIQHVDVPIITNNECENMYKSAGFTELIPNMFICAGINKGGRDSCEGDSGGPLTMVDNDGRSYLVGIISWGIGCALPSQPGVYTRITAFSEWISQIVAS